MDMAYDNHQSIFFKAAGIGADGSLVLYQFISLSGQLLLKGCLFGAWQKIESDAQAITLSNEAIEQLETKLQQKEVVLKVFASDLSFIQECALKDCDIKQEYTKASARFQELQV